MTETIEVTPPRERIETRMFETSRWDHVKLRPDDIIISTWGKSGTTLTQQIVHQLLTGGEDGVGVAVSPWVDVRFMAPLPEMVEMLEAQQHRRFLKTHLPFEAVPFSPSVKYVYIGRDARDVLWSAHNHASAFTDLAWAMVNASEGPWPKWSPPDPDVRAYYLNWLATDETPGFHDLSFWKNVQSWWDQRQRPNVILLHYANLISDMAGEMRRLAAFLEVDLDEARLPAMINHCSIDYMRQAAAGSPLDAFFEKGPASFFNRGTNGRWRDVLSAEEIARCDAVAAKRLTPDCAHWLRTGELPAE
jgi:aryl sulfotransferase